MKRTLKLLKGFIEKRCQGNRCVVMGLMVFILLAGSVGTWWLVVRADRNLPLQQFVDVYEAVRGLGFTTLSLQTEQRP